MARRNKPLPLKDLDLSGFRYIDGKLYREVGYSDIPNYRRVSINGVKYMAHRVIFFMHHGYEPDIVDHVDRNPLNNRIENLRPATKAENAHNTGLRADNSSGYRNVNWHNQKQKWQVRLTLNGAQKSYGLYATAEEAGAAAQELRKEHHGAFAA